MVDIPVKRSYRALYVAMGLMFVLLVGQLYNMQILQGSKYTDLAKGNREKLITTGASRGIIYDRTGQRLVVNNPSYSVAVTPADLPDLNCATGALEGAGVFNGALRHVAIERRGCERRDCPQAGGDASREDDGGGKPPVSAVAGEQEYPAQLYSRGDDEHAEER